MTSSLEGWPTKAKEAPSHEVKLAPLDTILVFQCLGEETGIGQVWNRSGQVWSGRDRSETGLIRLQVTDISFKNYTKI